MELAARRSHEGTPALAMWYVAWWALVALVDLVFLKRPEAVRRSQGNQEEIQNECGEMSLILGSKSR